MPEDSVLFTPLKTTRAFEEISAEIKRMIFTGRVKVGDRLPSETNLASQFGVNRHTIREALRRLESAGFIVMRKGGTGGPLVVNTILNTISTAFLDAFQMERAKTMELTKARVDIEKMVLSNAFETMDASDLDELRKNVSLAHSRIVSGAQAFEENRTFHKLLARATKNYVFIILEEAILAAVAHFHSFSRVSLQTSKKAYRAHVSILEYIEKGEREKALETLETHILEIGRIYEDATKE